MVTFQVEADGLIATVVTDESIHPDLLDELSRRCVRLFTEAHASLPEAEGGGDDDG